MRLGRRAGLVRRLLLPALAAVAVFAAPSEGRAQEPLALFDGETLRGWEVADYPGAGAVTVGDGMLRLGRGDPLTGVTWKGEFPRVDYELTLEGMRAEGSDFLAAITFPVGEEPVTLVLGGWGGRVVGLSSIAGADASENETRREMNFENGRWYRVRLRVTAEEIEAWIDDAQVVDFVHRGRLLSIRVDVWPNLPFGISSWQTTGALRNLSVRRLHPA